VKPAEENDDLEKVPEWTGGWPMTPTANRWWRAVLAVTACWFAVIYQHADHPLGGAPTPGGGPDQIRSRDFTPSG